MPFGWVRGGRGAFCITPQQNVIHLDPAADFPASIVYDFFQDPGAGIWMATDKGLISYYQNKLKRFGIAEGLRFEEVYRLLAADDGYLWMSGNFGLQQVLLSKLIEARDLGGTGKLSVRIFNNSDGMANAEANGGFWPAGWKMKNGELWFPTIQGAAIVQPSLLRETAESIPIVIEKLIVGDSVFSISGDIRLAAGTNNFEIRYSSVDFLKAADTRYSYRMNAGPWIQAGNRRRAYFASLAPGDYQFEVKAERYGRSSEVATLQFSIAPFFYQTMLFKSILMLLGAAVIALIIYLVKQEERRKWIQQQQVTKAHISGQERERQILGRELHDNINQQLTTAKLYLDISHGAAANDEQMIRRSEQVINDVINELRSMSKSLTPPTLRDIGLREALEELMDSYSQARLFTLDFHFSKDLTLLDPEMQLSIYRILQELMNNIVRHAEASHVKLQISGKPSSFKVVLEDNGNGFDPKTVRAGIGFANIKNRLELYRSNLTVFSEPGNGTRIEFQITA